jgi:hypothetical protein
VTNLLAQLGEYANVGTNEISLVDADSFWVDGDPAEINLMGYSQIVRGHVGSIARGINVANAQPNGQGLASQPDIHLGAPGATHTGACPHRSGARGCGALGRDDGNGADRSLAQIGRGGASRGHAKTSTAAADLVTALCLGQGLPPSFPPSAAGTTPAACLPQRSSALYNAIAH